MSKVHDEHLARKCPERVRTVQIDYDEEVTQRAVQHIFDMARAADDRPFFLQVSYTHPHEPYLCRQEFWDLYDEVEIPLPRTSPLSEDAHDPHSLRLLRDFGMLDADFTDAEIRRAIRAYYGSVSYIDSLVAQVLDALRATGADQNTAIVFTSDHGEMLGERGMWFKKHFFENALRVPMILHAPWITPQRVAEHVSLVDLLPTFAGLAGAPEPIEPLDGIDICSLLDRGNPEPERATYAEYLAEATPVPMFMIRRGRFKFITSSQDGDLLYDLEADPQERQNLAASPEHAETLLAFRTEAARHWDESSLTAAITLSQKRRRLVRDAMAEGAPMRWNHDEGGDDPVKWYRGKEGYNTWAFRHI